VAVGKDDIFGEDVKKSYFDETRQAGKSLYTVSTISYCDLHKINIDDLQTIMDAYPEFAGDFVLNFGVTFNLREVPPSSVHRYGEMTSQNLWSRYDYHFVDRPISWHNMWS